MNLLRRIKWFWQRGHRGWAECDTWDFDSYLAGVLAGGITCLAENGRGHPCKEEPDKCDHGKAWKAELVEAAERFRKLHEDSFGADFEGKNKAQDEAFQWLARRVGHLWD